MPQTHTAGLDAKPAVPAGPEARNAMVAQLVGRLAKAKGLTLRRLASEIGIAPNSLRYWLRHAYRLPEAQAERLADALEMGADDRRSLALLTGNGGRTAPLPGQEAPVAGEPPAQNALIVALLRRLLKAEGITWKELADRLGISAKSLRNWMARAYRLETHEVERLTEALHMSGENRNDLYVLTGKIPPPPPASELRRRPDLALYQELIDGLEHLSVAYTECWDIVIGNQAFRDIFGPVRPHVSAHPFHNTTRYVLFHPDSYLILGAGDRDAWFEDWLMPTLAYFSATIQQFPDHPRLRDMERDILERPDLRRAYRQAPAWIADHGDIAINQSARRFWDPRVDKVMDAHVITEAHQSYGLTLQRATFVLRERTAKAESAESAAEPSQLGADGPDLPVR
ncbi:helix-turn-helix domain-containing protein [Streptomyces sp. NPDC127084]|uniref:helix-turn-helix domain-containing protein n=1 Tax=Streptomyces sp. NPDC127084 TaxID=3347133 RepID=UPI0036595C20